MKKLLFTLGIIFTFSGLQVQAQQFLEDMNGRPILETKYTNVEGSPYLLTEWTEGVVKLQNGQSFKGIQLKYDQVADELLFQHKDQTLSFVQPVQEFKLLTPDKERLFRNGFKTQENRSEKMFFEVLFDGGTKLIGRRSKQITESKEYNSATTTQKFVPVESLYIVKDGSAIKIRKDKKSILSALSDKSARLEEYIKSNKVNLKEESGIILLVEYYNTI